MMLLGGAFLIYDRATSPKEQIDKFKDSMNLIEDQMRENEELMEELSSNPNLSPDEWIQSLQFSREG